MSALPGGTRRSKLFKAPWGFRYSKDGNVLERDEQEFAITEYVCWLQQQGLSISQIVALLAKRGMRGRRDAPLGRAMVHKMTTFDFRVAETSDVTRAPSVDQQEVRALLNERLSRSEVRVSQISRRFRVGDAVVCRFKTGKQDFPRLKLAELYEFLRAPAALPAPEYAVAEEELIRVLGISLRSERGSQLVRRWCTATSALGRYLREKANVEINEDQLYSIALLLAKSVDPDAKWLREIAEADLPKREP